LAFPGKRKETYYSKTAKEINDINISRGKTKEQLIELHGKEKVEEICKKRGESRKNNIFRRYSKVSELFFKDIQSNIQPQLFYGKNEKWIRYNKNKGFYVDLLYGNKIIEFNGNFYHANPLFYSEESIIIISKQNIKNAKDIWKRDQFKIDTLQKLGYKVLIIWENDLNKDVYKQTLEKCLNFLKYE
jgi:hypothetical protein